MLRVLLRLIRTIGGVFFDLLVFFRLNLRSGPALAAENLFLRKQLSLYVEKEKAMAGDGFRSLHPGPTLEIVRMARRSHRRKTGYADSMASERFSVVLEMEVPIRRPSAGPRRCSAVDRRNGNEQSDWGQERIANELLLKIGVQISPRTVWRYPAEASEAARRPVPTLDDVRS